MTLFIYRLAYSFLAVLSHLLLPLLPQKLRTSLMAKWRLQKLRTEFAGRERPILIHAASGEIEYAKPLIRELKRNYPRCPLVVMYSSPSLLKLSSSLNEVEKFIPAPFDLPYFCNQVLEILQPRLILYARTDVWPQFTLSAKKLQIPQILFAATFAENSSRLGLLSKKFTHLALSQLNEIHVVDFQDQTLLQNRLGLSSNVTGDTRYDQVFYRLFQGRQQKPLQLPTGSFRYVVFGSTWKEDEAILCSAANSYIEKNIKILWAPHEVNPKNIARLKGAIEALDLSVVLLSEYLSAPRDFDVLLVDKIGYLAELYEKAIWAFVGGSFKKQVHSVMEPLACGLRVIVGPYYKNNREAVHFSQKLLRHWPLVTVAHHLNEFKEKTLKLTLLCTDYEGERERQEIKALIQRQGGPTQRVLQTCEKYLRDL